MSATAKIDAAPRAAHPNKTGRALGPAALACMGVVFGDIGTSPLYTLGMPAGQPAVTGAVPAVKVLGILSLIFWSLIVVISFKYLIVIMRADNHGEGGILALLALVAQRLRKAHRGVAAIVARRPDRARRCSTATARSRRRSRS